MTPQEVLDEMAGRCVDIVIVQTDREAGDVRVGALLLDLAVGTMLAVEVGTGPDGRPAAMLRGLDQAGGPLALTVVELDDSVMVTT